MLETIALKKNKVVLSDYNYQRDIENRLLMAQFSSLDISVLEEILYSSLSISLKKLAKNISASEKEVRPIVQKLSQTGLLTLDGDVITVDKEMRKYYEAQIDKFDEDFCPGIEYLLGLLRKVPIHILPTWYSIPRTSNNIFDSIIEKHLQTPQIFLRYCSELNLTDPLLNSIVEVVYNSPDYKVRADELIEKFNLTPQQFEESILLLEFNFLCCLGYQKNDDIWEEVVTPFHEWREYLLFQRDSKTPSIPKKAKIERTREEDFSFVEDMHCLLSLAKKQTMTLSKKNAIGLPLPSTALCEAFAGSCNNLSTDKSDFLPYVHQLITKLCQLKLADIVDGQLCPLESAKSWFTLDAEARAIYLYRHPLNQITSVDLPPSLATDRHVREAEKSISRVLDSGWVYFDDFMNGVYVALSPTSAITLKKTGKTWKYALPSYSPEELALIRAAIFEGLFFAGMVATGTHDEKECFCVTPFGQSIFGS
ncbi:MAG: hypothetical protein HYX48_05125 [Chlamydiales bacterium]|nr:hypothetical protein [Chlamydiales bacterium]